MATAKKLAGKIARNASYAVAIAKAAINNGYDMDIKNAVEYEANLFGMTCSTHDKTEGMTAFLEKHIWFYGQKKNVCFLSSGFVVCSSFNV